MLTYRRSFHNIILSESIFEHNTTHFYNNVSVTVNYGYQVSNNREQETASANNLI